MCVYICVCCVCLCSCLCMCMYLCLYMCVCVCLFVRVSVCTCVCLCVGGGVAVPWHEFSSLFFLSRWHSRPLARARARFFLYPSSFSRTRALSLPPSLSLSLTHTHSLSLSFSLSLPHRRVSYFRPRECRKLFFFWSSSSFCFSPTSSWVYVYLCVSLHQFKGMTSVLLVFYNFFCFTFFLEQKKFQFFPQEVKGVCKSVCLSSSIPGRSFGGILRFSSCQETICEDHLIFLFWDVPIGRDPPPALQVQRVWHESWVLVYKETNARDL